MVRTSRKMIGLGVALSIAVGCGGKASSPREKADRQICHAGRTMIDDPGSTPFIGLANTYASAAIQRAGQAVIRDTDPETAVSPNVEPLRSSLAALRRVCGDKWR
jgi:hypothetical protein